MGSFIVDYDLCKPTNANIVAFSLVTPPKLQNNGLELFMDYLYSHPLWYALSDIADPFLLAHVCEFYYTCTFDPATHSLNGTIAGGTKAIYITPTTVRNALRLPVLQAYLEHPSEAECKSVLPSIGYNLTFMDLAMGPSSFFDIVFQRRGSWSPVSSVSA